MSFCGKIWLQDLRLYFAVTATSGDTLHDTFLPSLCVVSWELISDAHLLTPRVSVLHGVTNVERQLRPHKRTTGQQQAEYDATDQRVFKRSTFTSEGLQTILWWPGKNTIGFAIRGPVTGRITTALNL